MEEGRERGSCMIAEEKFVIVQIQHVGSREGGRGKGGRVIASPFADAVTKPT